MERFDKFDKHENSDSTWPKGSAAMIPGLTLVGIGVLFLLDNLGIVHVSNWIGYWPVILIAVGLVKLVDSVTTPGRIAGGVMLVAGGLCLADNLGYLHIEDMWPLILIGIGLFMLWNRTHPGVDYSRWWRYKQRRDRRDRRWMNEGFAYSTYTAGENAIHEFNVFTGSRRVITDQDFKGGKVACVFGGITLDLTGAAMSGKSAVLDVSAVYGGAVIRIPTSWHLELRGAGIFGGYSDQTVHPPMTPETKRLIVKGGAVFGGVTFKN